MPVATALIRSLAWEPPYAADEALKKKDKKIIDRREEIFIEIDSGVGLIYYHKITTLHTAFSYLSP